MEQAPVPGIMCLGFNPPAISFSKALIFANAISSRILLAKFASNQVADITIIVAYAPYHGHKYVDSIEYFQLLKIQQCTVYHV
jgi:hypothetical protein